jgi:hypothetical protein
MRKNIQKPIEKLGKIRDQLQFWDRIKDSDPRYEITPRKWADDIDSIGQERYEMS